MVSFFQALLDLFCWPFRRNSNGDDNDIIYSGSNRSSSNNNNNNNNNESSRSIRNLRTNSFKTPLLSKSPPGSESDTSVAMVAKLYDPVAVLSLSPEIATGYLILLGRPEAPLNDDVLLSSSSSSLRRNANRRRRGKRERHRPTSSSSSSSSFLWPELDESTLTLAFFAITDGNVVDTCFGVQAHDAHRDFSPSFRMAKEAKAQLAEAAAELPCSSNSSNTTNANTNFRRVAVESYARAFGIALACRHQLQQLDWLSSSACCFWKQSAIQRQAQQALEQAFAPLVESLQVAAAVRI